MLAVDYRLAPETKLAAVLEDVTDACAWVRHNGLRLAVDGTRLAVLGDSGGGYLALLTGHHVSPRPQVIVSLYGYGDITGNWLTTPSPFYLQQPLISHDMASAVVAQIALADAPTIDRLPFYVYCRQRGVWPREVVGRDPQQERDAFAAYCPAWNVDAAFPPTLLLHGTKDDDVPFAQSQQMAQALAAAGVDHELYAVADGGHRFDVDAEMETVQRAFDAVLAFLIRHLPPG